MKRTSLLLACLAALCLHAHALTLTEQADAFVARGVAAEQRGDLIAAESCYILALRVIEGHSVARAKLTEVEKKISGGAAGAAEIERKITGGGPFDLVLPKLDFRDATFAEATQYIEKKMSERQPSAQPRIVILDSAGKLSNRITVQLARTPAEQALNYVCSLANARSVIFGNSIVIFPKDFDLELDQKTMELHDKLEMEFESGCRAVEQSLIQEKRAARQNYLITVQRTFEATKRYGDRAVVAALQAEIALAGSAAAIPEIDPPGTAATLASLRTGYRSSANAARTARDTRFSALCNQYERSLSSMSPSVPPKTAAADYLQLMRYWLAAMRSQGTLTKNPLVIRGADVGADRIQATTTKLNRIVIPKLEFREVTVREAVEFLRIKSQQLDPDNPQTGVNIVLKLDRPSPSVPGAPGASLPAPTEVILPASGDPSSARITVSLSNIPLIEALKYVTNLTNLKFKVEPYAVYVLPLDVNANTLVTQTYRRVPMSFFAGTEMPTVSGDAPITDATKAALEKNGVTFTADALAIYFPAYRRLIVRNTAENIALVDKLVEAKVNEISPSPAAGEKKP